MICYFDSQHDPELLADFLDEHRAPLAAYLAERLGSAEYGASLADVLRDEIRAAAGDDGEYSRALDERARALLGLFLRATDEAADPALTVRRALEIVQAAADELADILAEHLGIASLPAPYQGDRP